MFGHIQRNCHTKYRCMKCGNNHSTRECTKPKTTPAKCANGKGEHLSISRRCKGNSNNPWKRRDEEHMVEINRKEERNLCRRREEKKKEELKTEEMNK